MKRTHAIATAAALVLGAVLMAARATGAQQRRLGADIEPVNKTVSN